MKFFLVADFRENYPSFLATDGILYNDHPKKESIMEILSIIQKLGYDCTYFGGIKELIKAVDEKRKYPNSFFINLTDGMTQKYSRVQAPVLLEMLGVPYSGSDVFGSALMNNKFYSKRALDMYDISMPKDILLTKYVNINHILENEIQLPVIIKPNHEGSSIGITQKNVCHSLNEIKTLSEMLLSQYDELIIEEYIPGYDVTNFIIGNKNDIRVNEAIVTKLTNSTQFSIYGALEKVQKLRTLYMADDIFDKDMVSELNMLSEQIFFNLHASDIARVDFRVHNREIYFLEINSAPRFSSNTEVGFICKNRRWELSKFINEYIHSALVRWDNNFYKEK